jgi:hypothetical protein
MEAMHVTPWATRCSWPWSCCRSPTARWAHWRSLASLRSGRQDLAARLALGATAVVHLYSASLYYASELLTGLPNVGDGFISVYIKFGLANSLWVLAPFFVFRFVYDGLVPAPREATQASA